MTDEDLTLAELSLAQKVKELCIKFMHDTGKEKILLKVSPVTGPTISFDDQGKTVVWDRHDVTVKAWTNDEFVDMLTQGLVPDPDEEDDDE